MTTKLQEMIARWEARQLARRKTETSKLDLVADLLCMHERNRFCLPNDRAFCVKCGTELSRAYADAAAVSKNYSSTAKRRKP